jgi:hypothetical protein
MTLWGFHQVPEFAARLDGGLPVDDGACKRDLAHVVPGGAGAFDGALESDLRAPRHQAANSPTDT